MNESLERIGSDIESKANARIWMDHMVAGENTEGDYLYEGRDSLPEVGSSVTGYYDSGEGSKPYIFRVVGICFYEVQEMRQRNSKSIGAILIDPVMENYLKETPQSQTRPHTGLEIQPHSQTHLM